MSSSLETVDTAGISAPVQWRRARVEANFAVVMLIIRAAAFLCNRPRDRSPSHSMSLVSLYLATADALSRHFGRVIAFRQCVSDREIKRHSGRGGL